MSRIDRILMLIRSFDNISLARLIISEINNQFNKSLELTVPIIQLAAFHSETRLTHNNECNVI